MYHMKTKNFKREENEKLIAFKIILIALHSIRKAFNNCCLIYGL